jgi:hypothetical protein
MLQLGRYGFLMKTPVAVSVQPAPESAKPDVIGRHFEDCRDLSFSSVVRIKDIIFPASSVEMVEAPRGSGPQILIVRLCQGSNKRPTNSLRKIQKLNAP